MPRAANGGGSIIAPMVELSRTVRFCLDPDPAAWDRPRHNGFAGWPPMRGLGRYYQLIVLARGEPDPQTGYFMDIRHMDAAVRRHALPVALDALRADSADGHGVAIGTLMDRMFQALDPALDHTLIELALALTPFLHVAQRRDDVGCVLIRHRYEFAAAHRLHVPQLDDEANRRIFGKCNNPAGHGHNYELEVAVRVPVTPRGDVLSAGELDALVDRCVLQKLDHKHLNVDVPQFEGVNPSVENIARIIFEMLDPHVPSLDGHGTGRAELDSVSVWETPKTVCTYRRPARQG